MHTDLRRHLEEESRDRDREIDKIMSIISKNQQQLSVLPIQISDRLENILRRFEKGVDARVDGMLEDVRSSLNDVRGKLWTYLQIREKERSDESQAPVAPVDEDVTGRIELLKGGEVKVLGTFSWDKLKSYARVGKWVVVTFAAGGGIVGLIEALKAFLG